MESIPYATQTIDEADLRAVAEVLTSGWLTQGPAVPKFEAQFAQRHETAHAVAVCNATAGLHIACLALGAGPGKRVWTSPNSFLASANCALYCGADIDFVDIDPATRNMSTATLSAKLAQAEQDQRLPHIVIPVHFGGLPCDMQALRSLADRYGFFLLEDASHAVGASYQGRPVGSRYADASVFSFHPVKIITTAEGGMVTTQDAALAEQLRLLRSHGMVRDAQDPRGWYYEQRLLGFNYRMTDMQAALGSSQIARLGALAAARERLAKRYRQLLAGLPLKLPTDAAPGECSWHLYPVEIIAGAGVASRADAFARMRAGGIGVNVHYIPIHLQPFYRDRGFRPGQFPNAEKYYEAAMSLPLYPTLTDALQDRVAAALRAALET
jgi:UDP-4-amino-4,6-dideoxy-N-acetyl-beta-L-altrosamine transaminase